MFAGALLSLGRDAARPSRRRLAGRLFYGGFALLFLVPGFTFLIGVVLGYVMWPALLFGSLALVFGFGALYGLRLHWDDP